MAKGQEVLATPLILFSDGEALFPVGTRGTSGKTEELGDKVCELAESQQSLRGLVSGPALTDTIVTTGIIWSESLAFGKLVLVTYQAL